MKTEVRIRKEIAAWNEARIGGNSFLPKEIRLPITTLEEEGAVNQPPSLLFTIPISSLNNLNNREQFKDYYCSVFFDCDTENYEYISIMQDFYKEEYLATIVVIHKNSKEHRNDACFEPAYRLDINNNINEEAEWIQDKIEWNGYNYICEFDTLEIDKLKLDINLTFDSAKGYLFIKEDWKPNQNCGAFLLQNS